GGAAGGAARRGARQSDRKESRKHGPAPFRARFRPSPPYAARAIRSFPEVYAPRQKLPMRRKRAKMRRKRANESGVTLGGLVTPLNFILVVGGPLMRMNVVPSSYPGPLRDINSS